MTEEAKRTRILEVKEVSWLGDCVAQVKFNPETFLGYRITGELFLEAVHNYERVKAENENLRAALLEITPLTLHGGDAIVWHLRNGENDAGLSKDALALWVECLVKQCRDALAALKP